MEHIAADQIISHLNQHNLMEEKQSAYKLPTNYMPKTP